MLAIAAVVAIDWAIARWVEQYTDSRPIPLPRVELPPAELETLEARLEAFRQAVEGEGAVPPLELATPEINALIQTDAPFLRDRVHVAIEGDQIQGQVSLALGDLPVPFVQRWVRGRYLNGAAAFRASFEGGVLIVTLESLEVRGSAVPERVMEEIRKENLAKDAYAELLARLGRKVERIEVKDGRILVLGKGARTL